MECGLFQGHRRESYERNRNFEYPPSTVEAVLLSHAHIDHSGNLPNLVKQGFSGPIFTTPATASLADIMLQDSGYIQESDAEYLNKKRLRRGEELVEPIYTQRDALKVAPLFSPRNYTQKFEVVPGVSATFFDAGHILGSSAIRLEINENGVTKKFWFSGDIGRNNLPLLRDPVLPHDTETLMMECTYGDKPHEDPMEAHREFHQVVLETVKRGGKIIIPAFAVGRTQELVYSLSHLVDSGKLKPIPVFVDSPLAVRASQIFERHPECYDAETMESIRRENHPALSFSGLKYVQSVEESKQINYIHEPMVIISASGMAEAGRILHHLKNNIENPQNTICIVGWQAPNTLGRRLAMREKEVRIFGETYTRRAEIATIGGLSAHAGQNLLVKYATAQKDIQQVILVHGEEDAALALRARLSDAGVTNVIYPERLRMITI